MEGYSKITFILKVLDLEGAPINELPDEVVIFFNLRYLNLTRTQVKELPKSIGKLCNLESLLLKATQIEELPSGIVKLKNLRHLVIYHSSSRQTDYERWVSMCVPSSIFSMKSLQVLTFVKAGDTSVKELRKMTQLKRLGIANVKEANEKDLCRSIGNLSLLRYLLVMSCNEEERLKMDALVSPPSRLEKLFSCLEIGEALPNLGRVTLVNAYEGDQLCFLEGFQKLKVLRILKCPELKKIVINKGVMHCLQRLEITECQKFVKLPHDWESLPDLKEVCLWDVSSEIIHKTSGAPSRKQQTIRGIDFIRVEAYSEKLKEVYGEFGWNKIQVDGAMVIPMPAFHHIFVHLYTLLVIV
ncbi:hypothetical protein REPUB_Repub16aG0074200 [Reevesia pubescens]